MPQLQNHNHRDLVVWKNGIDLARSVYRITTSFLLRPAMHYTLRHFLASGSATPLARHFAVLATKSGEKSGQPRPHDVTNLHTTTSPSLRFSTSPLLYFSTSLLSPLPVYCRVRPNLLV